MANTLGGVAAPRFLLLDDNYVTNPYANEDTSGWAVTGGTLIKGAAQEGAYGEFMFDYSYAADFEAAYWNQDIGASSINKIFIASFRAKLASVGAILVEIVDSIGEVVASQVYSLTTGTQRVLLYGSSDQVLTQNLRLKIYASASSATAQIFFDHVLFTEVLAEVDMPSPLIVGGEQDILKFQKEVQGKNELWNGLTQEFGKKWRPHYLGRWDYLVDTDELLRQSIADSKTIFVLPHNDQNWGFHGMWDKDLERKYAFGRYIGHKGVIPIRGVEFIYELPTSEPF